MKRISNIIASLAFPAMLFSCSEGTGSGNAQPETQLSVDSFIIKTINSIYEKEKIHGIMVAVLENGQRKYHTAGYANPDKKMRFDSTTLFEAGSITKTFTAYIVEKVLSKKGISDSTSIIGYLPDSVRTNKSLEKVSFLSLVNHTSGFPRLPSNLDLQTNPMTPYDNYTEHHLYSYLRSAVPQPNGKSNYSNLGMGLAGALAERISGKTYAELLREYIFIPFDMNNSGLSSISNENNAQGYFEGAPSGYWNMNILSPAGGIKCSSADMLTYLQKMAIPVNDSAKALIDKLLEPTIAVNEVMKVGRGWHTMEWEGKPIVYWHNGGTYGFSTYAGFIKGRSRAVVIVINHFNKNAISDHLGFEIMKKLSD
jgi:D-alanyl-D-alanine-carboxypeptidase/D-alanyl-D-alanine-endopeptidase